MDPPFIMSSFHLHSGKEMNNQDRSHSTSQKLLWKLWEWHSVDQFKLAAAQWSTWWPWHLTTPPPTDCCMAWSAGLGAVQFNTGCCYLSGTNLPIKQIRLLSSPGTGLSGSFESVLSLPSHQHVHLSITFPWRGDSRTDSECKSHSSTGKE